MTKKLSLSHKIMGKIAMVTPESPVAKSILKITQGTNFHLWYFSLGRRTTIPRSRRGKASLSSLAHNSSPGWRRWGILQLVLMFLSSIISDVPFFHFFVSGGGGGGRLVGCGCCGDICKKSFAPRRIEIQTVALSNSRPALCWHGNGRLMSNVGSIQKW